jgi:hypothetical protein
VPTKTPEYDLAISFLAQDEPLATQLADELRDRYRIFVYSERQKDLAGKDGVDEFSRVFKERSRVVVILFRSGWGDTKWTRVEETAIKERAFESGWDFLVVIALTAEGAPVWLPKTKIWVGWERFGLPAAAAVIDARIQEAGGTSKRESARERAERLARIAERRQERESWLHSSAAVQEAADELEKLFSSLENECSAIESTKATPIRCTRGRYDRVCCVRTPLASFTVGWSQQYSNSLKYSSLLLNEYDGTYFLEEEHGGGMGESVTRRGKEIYTFDIDDSGIRGWRTKSSDQFFDTATLGDDLLRKLLDRVDELQTSGRHS